MSQISIKNLLVSFDTKDANGKVLSTKKALSDINLDIEEGDFICILGKNGSGKSTLGRTLNGLIAPTEGDVLIYGMNTKDESKTIDIRKNVGITFQNPDNQIVASIVEEDVAFGLENIGIETNEMRKRIDSALSTLHILDLKDSLTSKLSGGQKQKVAIAGILAMKSRIMILDEPTSMLDKVSRDDLLYTLKELNEKEKLTIILISHYVEEMVYAKRVLVMSSGRVLFDDTPSNILLKGNELENAGIEPPYVSRIANALKDDFKYIKGDETKISELCQYLK